VRTISFIIFSSAAPKEELLKEKFIVGIIIINGGVDQGGSGPF
jgi:hypothetical protein